MGKCQVGEWSGPVKAQVQGEDEGSSAGGKRMAERRSIKGEGGWRRPLGRIGIEWVCFVFLGQVDDKWKVTSGNGQKRTEMLQARTELASHT